MKNLLLILFVAALAPAGFGQGKGTLLFNDSTISKVTVTYHANGVVESNGHYIQGKKSGDWNYWNENGSLIKFEQFKNGLNIGDYIEYYPNGVIKVKGKYVITDEISKKYLYWFYYNDKGELLKSLYFFEGFQYEYDKDNVLISKKELK